MGWNRILIAFIFVFLGISAQAQTWSEWFSQKKTQQKYLLEQVAALKLYAGYLRKGYEIGKSGLGFIKDAGKGEFDLHGAFFASLKSVSPAIKDNIRVAEIIRMQIDVSKTLSWLTKISGLGEENREYLEGVSDNLRLECLRDLEELLLVVTSGRADLTDDERLVRIEHLHGRMEEKRNFAFGFAANARSLSAQRTSEMKNIKRMEEWYENK